MICAAINQTIAPASSVAADAPAFDHGDTEERPRPVPNARRMSDSAAATTAPPKTAAHDTPDADTSTAEDDSADVAPFGATIGVVANRSMCTCPMACCAFS